MYENKACKKSIKKTYIATHLLTMIDLNVIVHMDASNECLNNLKES